MFPSQHRIKHDVGDVRLLVILNPEQDETEQRAEFRTAHEIAHHWCGHCVGSARTPEEYEQLEQEADSQANEWGFPGKSTRMAR